MIVGFYSASDFPWLLLKKSLSRLLAVTMGSLKIWLGVALQASLAKNSTISLS